MSELAKQIRRCTKQVIENEKLADVRKGTVITADPLAVQLDQKITLKSEALILTANVMDHDVDAVIASMTDSGGDTVSGTTVITLKYGLLAGEEVWLLQCPGGQKFVILDRVR